MFDYSDDTNDTDAESIVGAPVGMDSPTTRSAPPSPKAVAATLQGASSKGMTEVILGQVQQNNATLAERYPVVQQMNKEHAEAQVDELVQAATIGNNNQVVASAKLLADSTAQLRTVQTASNLGVTGSMDAADLLNKRAIQWREASEDAMVKADKYRHDSEVQFLQDPAGYVKAQFFLDNTARAAQDAQDRKTQIAGDIVYMQKQTQEAQTTYNAIKVTETQESIEAQLSTVAAQSAAGIDRMKAANAGIAVEGLRALNEMDTQKLSNFSVANAALIQQQQLGIAQQQLSLSKKTLQVHIDEFNERMELKKVAKEELDTAGQLLSEGFAITGQGKGDKIPSSMVANYMKTPEGQAAYTRAIQSRLVGSPIVASSLGDIAKMVGQDGVPLLPQQASVKNLMGGAWALANDPIKAKEMGVTIMDPKNPDAVKAGAAQIAYKEAAAYLSNIKPGDKANPYQAPPYNTVMEIPGVQQSALYQKVLKPQHLAGGIQDVNPDNLIASVTSAIKGGQITHAEGVQGVQAIFNGIVVKNKLNNNYLGMHLPNQDSYNTMIMTPQGIPKMRNLTSLPDINVIIDNQLRGVTTLDAVTARSPFTFN